MSNNKHNNLCIVHKRHYCIIDTKHAVFIAFSIYRVYQKTYVTLLSNHLTNSLSNILKS